MRLLGKLAMKFAMMVFMVVLMGGVMRYAQPYLMKAAGVPAGLPGAEGLADAHLSSDETDLMATVLKSALRLFSGSAKREELAGELSDKLCAGRTDSGTMSELGIELVKPGTDSPTSPGLPKPGNGPALSKGEAGTADSPAGPARTGKPNAVTNGAPAEQHADKVRAALLSRLSEKARANPELSMVPVVLLGMVVVHRVRRRRQSPEDAFMLPEMTLQTPTDSEPFAMKHPVHSLKSEDFELLIALVYQRQGYRVSMPAALGGGRGGDFLLLRKSERLLVKCKNVRPEHKVAVERVRELREAMTDASATRGLYVVSGGFSWDARNFAKAKGVTVINARTLDELISAARERPDEDLLAVPQWAPDFMKKVTLTPPLCPACEAAMEQLNVSEDSGWVCSQRPECRGRRSARKHQKPRKIVA